MEQHPIPQQISSYEFKLVGEMTLKQFLKAGAGIVLAVLINGTGITGIIKWPLMILSAGIGLMFAFVPFEDRPLEVWIKAFIKSIYSPSIYTYKKKIDHSWLASSMRDEEEEEEKKEEKKKNDETDEIGNQTGKRNTKEYLQTISLEVKDKKTKRETENNVENKVIIGDKGVKTEEVNGIREEKTTIQQESWKNQKVDLNLETEKLGATGQAVFGAIPMPDRPDVPNLIVGMATDKEGKIVDGVIVEIQDEHGSSSRVLKTNSLGQFKISTPLSNGRYLIIAEKEGYTFDRVNVDLIGQIVEPIRIIAHN